MFSGHFDVKYKHTKNPTSKHTWIAQPAFFANDIAVVSSEHKIILSSQRRIDINYFIYQYSGENSDAEKQKKTT